MKKTKTYPVGIKLKLYLWSGLRVIYTLVMCLHLEAAAQNTSYRDQVISSTQLTSLGNSIRAPLVSIRRQAYPAKGYHLPQQRVNWGQGILVTEHLVLTSTHWLTLNPDESKLFIQTACLHNQKSHMVDTRIVAQSDKEGWSILKAQSTLSCKSSTQIYSGAKPIFHIGRGLYVAEPKPRLPSRLTLSGIAPSPMHFYWLISGHLISGTPLFDQNGHLITLAVMPYTHTDTDHLYSLVLPPKSIQSAFERIRTLMIQSN